MDGDLRQPLRAEQLDRGGSRCAAAGVQADEPLRLGVPDDGEQVAADPAGHRLDHAEHGVRGDRRIDGIATLLQDADGGRGRQRLAGRGHPLPGDHRRSGLVQRAGRPVVRPGTSLALQAQPYQARHRDQQAPSPDPAVAISSCSFASGGLCSVQFASPGEAVDRITVGQCRLRTGLGDGQRGGGVGPGGGLAGELDRVVRDRDRQRTIEGVAGADGINGLDLGRGDGARLGGDDLAAAERRG